MPKSKAYNFGPKNEAEEIVFAEEGFLVDVQVVIHGLMLKQRVTRTQLAKKLFMSRLEVDELLAGDLTVRDVGRIFYAIGLEPELTVKK